MNNRIKELRKTLGLTMEKFGERLGVSKVAISKIEKGQNNLSSQMFKSICREFNVSECWLRSGEGEMFHEATEEEQLHSMIDRILNSKNEHIKTLFKNFAKLNDNYLDALDGILNELLSDTSYNTSSNENVSGQSIEELESEYKKSRLHSAQKTGLSASNITEENDAEEIS